MSKSLKARRLTPLSRKYLEKNKSELANKIDERELDAAFGKDYVAALAR